MGFSKNTATVTTVDQLLTVSSKLMVHAGMYRVNHSGMAVFKNSMDVNQY